METTQFNFAHHKLDCYRAARELADLVMVIAPNIPKGHYKMKDQVVRAATAVEALIAEGANPSALARIDPGLLAKTDPSAMLCGWVGDAGSGRAQFVAVGSCRIPGRGIDSGRVVKTGAVLS